MANYPTTTGTQFTGTIDLTDGGSVGIGTTAPAATLAVANTGSGCITQALFGQGKTSGQSQVCIGQAATSNEALSVGYDHGSNYGFIQVAGVSIGGSVVLASNGNVGVGTTTPAQKLDVNGNINAKGSMTASGNVQLTGSSGVILPQLTSAPVAVDGMIAYADGANWNPGSGKGMYAYYNSCWNKL